MNEGLTKTISELEIKQTLDSRGADRAPGDVFRLCLSLRLRCLLLLETLWIGQSV